MIKVRLIACCVALAALTACTESGERVLTVNATGTLRGTAFLDRDGDLKLTTTVDGPFPKLRVSVYPVGSTTSVGSAVTDTLGFFRIPQLPVGSYRIDVDNAALGDSVRFFRVDSARVTLAANDSTGALIIIGYAAPKAVDVRNLAAGKRTAFEGIALNSWTTFGDSIVHVADSTGVIRLVNLKPIAINTGAKVRVLGTVAKRDGRTVLTDVAIVSNVQGEAPVPTDVPTAAAAAGSGKLEAALVRVKSAVVQDGASLTNGDVLLTVDDKSGALEVLIDAKAGINPSLPISKGAELDVTGLLVPVSGTTRWRLKPRTSTDLAVRYPPVTISAARVKASGQIVVVQAIALNDLTVFGDLTLHLTDATGSIRAFVNTLAFVSAGDSVSVLGTIALRNGQPAIVNATASVLSRRATIPVTNTTTGKAATADGGKLDAALVKLTNAVVKDTATFLGEAHFTVDDNTGKVEVIIDAEAAIPFQMPAPNTRLDLTGVLVPLAGTSSFSLKPRSLADITVR